MFTCMLIGAASAATQGPCDILVAAGNPCVAAHSTVRALYSKYDGPLYNVTRASDGKSALINVDSAGGFADIKAHEAFCPELDCVISNVMDQSPQKNHLGQRHKLVNASEHKITVGGGVEVYGMWFEKGYGYHVDATTGVATGNDPQSIYAVMSGTHFNGGCCFDYGNSETNDRDDGAGAMEAIYFGNAHWHGNTGAGDTGPWVGADLESGMYYGGGNVTKANPQSQPLTSEFVSLYLRGRTDGFMLKGGDATKGTLTTMYDGPRPFQPMPNEPPSSSVAAAAGNAPSTSLLLTPCTAGADNQTFSLYDQRPERNGTSIATVLKKVPFCFDIGNFATKAGSAVGLYTCPTAANPHQDSKDNEFWAVAGATIKSMQHDTPFCFAISATGGPPHATLADCADPDAQFTIGFTAAAPGTVVHKASGKCLTAAAPPAPRPPAGYQPMKKQGAIILATGGDNSNSAVGNFYEGIMVTGTTTDEVDEQIQANIVAVGYKTIPGRK